MIADVKMDMRPAPTERPPLVDEAAMETQRSGTGLLVQILFPLISMAAIAFAAYELVR